MINTHPPYPNHKALPTYTLESIVIVIIISIITIIIIVIVMRHEA